MSLNFRNEAAWIVAEKSHPLEVSSGPKPDPIGNEIVIKVAYAAVNPTDYKVGASTWYRSSHTNNM
jgi:NADPH:quinone reductase-like Zn-dependent oxidoreductase